MDNKKIVAFLLAGAMFFSVAPSANAQTIGFETLQKQILALKQQIQQLLTTLSQLQAPKTGGNCTYGEFKGKCTVTEFAENAGTSPTVKYSFVPDETPDMNGIAWISADKLNPYLGETSSAYLGLSCLKGEHEPTAAQTAECGVVKGAVFDCVLSVIKTGSCTPVNVRFKDKNTNTACPEARTSGAGESCATAVVYAKDPVSKQCCEYGTSCAAPESWTPYASKEECASSCGDGDKKQYTCGDGAKVTWCKCVNKKMACVNSPETLCPAPCAAEGARISGKDSAAGKPATCCKGLTAVSSCDEAGQCDENGSLVCAYCGDKICGLGENKKNCKADCGISDCEKASTADNPLFCRAECLANETAVYSGCNGSLACCKKNISCAGAGQYTSGAVAPAYQYGCCSGLASLNPWPAGLAGGGNLCYDPAKDIPFCSHKGSKSEGWYYQDGTLLKWAACP